MFWSHKTLHQEVPKHSKQHPWLLLNGALKYLDIIIILWTFFCSTDQDTSCFVSICSCWIPWFSLLWITFWPIPMPENAHRNGIYTDSGALWLLTWSQRSPNKWSVAILSEINEQAAGSPSSLPKTDNEGEAQLHRQRNCEKIWIWIIPVHFYLTNLSAVDTVEFWSFQMIHGHMWRSAMFF